MLNRNNLSPILIGLVSLLLGLVIGFGVFFYVSFKQPELLKSAANGNSDRIVLLTSEITSLKAQLQDAKNNTSQVPTEKIEEDPQSHQLTKPLIIFKPINGYSSTEKESITERLLNPYFDFYNDRELDTVVIVVTKNTPPVSGYYYTITAQTKGGGTTEFLYSVSNTNLDWWLPECSTKCEFSEEYKAKYPNIVSQF